MSLGLFTENTQLHWSLQTDRLTDPQCGWKTEVGAVCTKKCLILCLCAQMCMSVHVQNVYAWWCCEYASVYGQAPVPPPSGRKTERCSPLLSAHWGHFVKHGAAVCSSVSQAELSLAQAPSPAHPLSWAVDPLLEQDKAGLGQRGLESTWQRWRPLSCQAICNDQKLGDGL